MCKNNKINSLATINMNNFANSNSSSKIVSKPKRNSKGSRTILKKKSKPKNIDKKKYKKNNFRINKISMILSINLLSLKGPEKANRKIKSLNLCFQDKNNERK